MHDWKKKQGRLKGSDVQKTIEVQRGKVGPKGGGEKGEQRKLREPKQIKRKGRTGTTATTRGGEKVVSEIGRQH